MKTHYSLRCNYLNLDLSHQKKCPTHGLMLHSTLYLLPVLNLRLFVVYQIFAVFVAKTRLCQHI